MPSGKRSRELRTHPVAPSARARRAAPRVLLIGAAAVAALAVAILLAVVLSSGSSSTEVTNAPAVGSLTNALAGATEVETLFKGIPQRRTTLGSQSAPVTMVEYVDAQCPFCRMFETQVLPDVIRRYVRTGKLKIVLRMWAFIGPDSSRGQATVLAAARQNRAFNYLELMFDQQGTENSGWLSDGLVTSIAASIPTLRVHRLLAERNSSGIKAEATTVAEIARSSGVTSTPTFIVGRTGRAGTKVALSGPTDEHGLIPAIEAAL
jgi:protein-disulfide isomerase